MTKELMIGLAIAGGLIALLYVILRSMWIKKQPVGMERMEKIASYIAEGARAFLRAEYRILIWFVLVVAILLAFTAGKESHWLIAVSFIVGALASALAGYIGMTVATMANVRTTEAARSSLNKALRVAFVGGSVMGLAVVGLGLLGIGILLLVYTNYFGADTPEEIQKIMNIIAGFSFGASSIALFARVGGGIYTKGADVGADLVGKVEAGIPEDHPLNPATIADNVGDNVGDVAGMGADLFESYVGSIISAMVLGAALAFKQTDFTLGISLVFLPIILAALGIVASLIGTFFVNVKEDGDPQWALNKGELVAGIIYLAGSYFLIDYLIKGTVSTQGVFGYIQDSFSALDIWIATVIGLIVGIAIGFITEYYTGAGKKPVWEIVKQSVTGVATNIIAGLGVGMKSTALPIILLGIGILLAYHFAGLYGIALAAVGMLANTGIQLAVDAYGPIADNAGGIAEMSELPPEVRSRTDKLDAVGNTTAAIGKGFAIGSAALTALAFFAAYMTAVGLDYIDIANPKVVVGLFIGGMLAFLFSSLAIDAVGQAAMAMVKEVRRQFSEIPELKAALKVISKHIDEPVEKWPEEDRKVFEQAEGKAEYGKCVEIATTSALKKMMVPGLLAVITPIIVGFAGGPEMLGGLLAGVLTTGVLLAIFQANSGAAWDNAKKMVEQGVEIDGVKYGKGSDLHKATVVGDTVGDPLKDTSGPSLNILIKLMSVIALILAGIIAGG